MINRRDLLKAIGIGGILPFVGKTEVEAAPPEVQPQTQLQYIPPYEGLGSISIYGQPGTWAHAGTLQYIPGRDMASHGEWAEWAKTLRTGGTK